MKAQSFRKLSRLRWLAVAGALVFQQGCLVIDPDILANGIFQFLNETAIFFSNAVISGGR